MTNAFTVYAKTALSPEWDRGFDEEFTELISGDPDFVREEFDALIGANWTDPPEPPTPPAPTGLPERSPRPPDNGTSDNGPTTPTRSDGPAAGPLIDQRSPP